MSVMNLKGWVVLMVLFTVGVASALPIYVSPLDGEDLQPGVTFSYVFNFTTGSDCSGVLLSSSSDITTKPNGIGFVDIDISSLTTKPNYLCEYRDGSLRKVHSFSDMILDDVLVSSLDVSGDVDASGSGFFGFLGSLANRISKLWASEIDVSGNVTAGYFIGDGSGLVNLNLSGVEGSTQWTTNGSDIYYNDGNVGIGTASPGAKLHVESVGYGSPIAQFETSGRPLVIGAQSGYVYMGYGNREQFKIAGTAGIGRFILGSGLSDDTVNTLQVQGSSYFEGNVGIGTTSPSTKLEVAGSINFTSGLLIFPDGTSMNTASGASGTYVLKSGDTMTGDLIVDKDAGVIRIDSSSGRPTVQVKSTGTATGNADSPVLQLSRWTTGFTTGNVGEIRFDGLGTGGGYVLHAGITANAVGANTVSGAPTDLIFQVNDGSGAFTAMTIEDDGDVGIGTGNPSGTLKLDVEGQIGATAYCDETGANCIDIESVGENNLLKPVEPDYTWSTSTLPRDFEEGLQLSFVGSAGGYDNFGTVLRGHTYSNDGASFEMYYPYSPAYGGDSIKYRLGLYNNAGWTNWRTFWDDNNDGAGSGLDADLLDGFNSSDFLGGASQWTTSGNDIYYNDGNVGIGTDSPERNFELQGSGNVVAFQLSNTGTGGRTWSLFSTNDGSGLGGGKFVIYDDTSGVDRIVVDNTGNVGIGTDSPQDILHINKNAGNLRMSTTGQGQDTGITFFEAENLRWRTYLDGASSENSYIIEDNVGTKFIELELASNNILLAQSSGNVGIGTSSPSAKLHVKGGDVIIDLS